MSPHHVLLPSLSGLSWELFLDGSKRMEHPAPIISHHGVMILTLHFWLSS